MSDLVTDNLPLIATAPDGIKRLRGLILELAVRGKLVPQDPADEPASELLKRIEARVKAAKTKPQPTVTDDEQSFLLPDGWVWVHFGSIAQHNSGKTLDKGRNTGTPRRYITTSNLYWGRFELDNAKEMLIRDEELERCTARKNDLLICEGGEAGRAAVWESHEEVCFQNHVHRARMLGGINPYYAFRFFEKLDLSGEINLYRKGVGISNLSGKSLASIPFPLPPLSEQHRIVARVDELMALCDRLEAEQADAAEAHARLVDALLATLVASRDALDTAANWQRLSEHFDTLFTTEASINALKQTVLQLAVMGRLVSQDPTDEPASELLKRIEAQKVQLVKEGKIRKPKVVEPVGEEEWPFEAPQGWRFTRLDDVLSITGGVTLGRKIANRQLVSRPYLRVANVQRGHLLLEQLKFVDIPDGEIDKYELHKGDLLVTEGGDWDKVGRTAIWHDEVVGCLHQNHVFKARPLHPEWSSRWTELYLNSAVARSYFAGASKQTTNLASINMTQLKAFVLALPPLPEQHRIVAKVDELMALCDRLQAGLATAREHRARLADTLVQAALEAA